MSGLIEAGKIKPVIDRTYRLNDIVEAHRFVDTGRKRGSVVLAVLNPIASQESKPLVALIKHAAA